MAWELAAWLEGNGWESEDGPTKVDFCWLEEWDRAFTWIGNHRVAIEDTGDGESPACTRVFDLAQAASPGSGRARQAAEIAVLHGPEGRFFSDGATLLSSSQDGLSRWDPFTGARTGFTPAFSPAYCNPATRELAELTDGRVRRAPYA
jgi:PAS domain-containing protein